MNSPGRQPRVWIIRLAVIALSVLLHGALLGWLLTLRTSPTAIPSAQVVAVELVELPPPAPEPEPDPIPEPEPEPEPEPVPEPEPERAPEPPPRPAPPKAVAPRPAPPAGPPVHTFGANQDWAAPAATPPPDPTAVRGRPVPSAYADTVKGRVTAQLKRPEGSVYKPPPGYKGDPNDFKRQCYIPYEITVDANGRMLSYEIDRCGDELLDAAAERAVRGAGPFPPPPNQGAEKYVIYGTAIFIN